MNEKEPIVGWKAALIVAGMAGFLILASFVANDHDRTTAVAPDQPAGTTIGLAPPTK